MVFSFCSLKTKRSIYNNKKNKKQKGISLIPHVYQANKWFASFFLLETPMKSNLALLLLFSIIFMLSSSLLFGIILWYIWNVWKWIRGLISKIICGYRSFASSYGTFGSFPEGLYTISSHVFIGQLVLQIVG